MFHITSLEFYFSLMETKFCVMMPKMFLSGTDSCKCFRFFLLLLGVEGPFTVQDKYIIMLQVCAVFLFF